MGRVPKVTCATVEVGDVRGPEELALSSIVSTLFIALWLIVALAAAYYYAKRFFHEPRRADVATAGVAVGLGVGIVIGVVTAPRDHVAPPAGSAPVRPPGARDVAARCGSAIKQARFGGDAGPQGTVDMVTITATRHAVADGSDVSSSSWIEMDGWTLNRNVAAPLKGVCLLVDQVVEPRGVAYYGVQRDDVRKALKGYAPVGSGYVVGIPPGTLPIGTHRIETGALEPDGTVYVVGLRTVTVK